MPQRILILIVAYNAERHIEGVLQRLPASLEKHPGWETEVLVLDDASTDGTWQTLQHIAKTRLKPIKLGRNSFNQGYGGNQKIGYRYAVEQGYDAVVLMHGDGQYPPEYIEALAGPIITGQADAVLGSRMRIRKNALKGGMPLYKWAGNQLLTGLQNRLLGSRLSEFHTGLRAYRVNTLAGVPFEANYNDFGFDADILIQLIQTKARIEEIDIPTHYGDEVCHVNSMKYGLQCIRSCVLARVQHFSIFYQRKFDYAQGEPGYSDKTGFESSHSWAVRNVPQGSRVLEIGCGRGFFISRKLAEKGCAVRATDCFAVDNMELPAGVHYRQIHRAQSLDLSVAEKDSDAVVLLDVIEHVDDPEAFLTALREHMQRHLPYVYITTPNIAFAMMRISLLLGKFNYGKKGILDRTHKRLFTFKSLKRALRDANFVIEKVEGIPAPLPLVIQNERLCRLLMALNSWLVKRWKSLFAYQIAVVARVTPMVETLMMEGAGK